VKLDDGSTLESEVRFPPGHDKNPLSDEQLSSKFRGLVEPVLGQPRSSELWNRLSRVETDPRPHEAIELLAD